MQEDLGESHLTKTRRVPWPMIRSRPTIHQTRAKEIKRPRVNTTRRNGVLPNQTRLRRRLARLKKPSTVPRRKTCGRLRRLASAMAQVKILPSRNSSNTAAHSPPQLHSYIRTE